MKHISTTTCKTKKSVEYIRHEYPTDGKYHPFDITSNLQQFLFAEGYTYLMDETKTKLIPNIKKVIPKSYMPFSICERCFMIYKGDIVWKNKNYSEAEIIDYKILSLHKEKIQENFYSHNLCITQDINEDIEKIKKISKKNDNIYLFAKII